MGLWHRCHPLLILAGFSVLAVLAGLVADISPNGDVTRDEFAGEWRHIRHNSHATSHNPVPSSPIEQPYTLRLVRTITPKPPAVQGIMYFASDMLDTPGTSIIAIEDIGDSARDEPRVVAWDASGAGEPVSLGDGRLLSPFRAAASREPRILCWNPRLSYERVSSGSGLVAADLFVLNYSREANLVQNQCFLGALRAAARGESLRVESFLETRTAEGLVVTQTRLNPTYNPTSAIVVELDGHTVGLVNFNSGYQVSETLYRELTLPRLRSREFESPRASTRSYGSFRGMLAVDLESGGILWERRLGVIPKWGASADLDGDGIEEIVLSAYSPGNGISACGTTDSGCGYVLCLDTHGHEIWRYRLCGWFVGAAVAIGDVNGDGMLEVVAAFGSVKDPDKGLVAVLASTGDVLAESEELGSAVGLVLADLTGDGTDEILSSDTHGRLVALNGGLQVMATVADTAHTAYGRSRLRPIAANDLDGDGTVEIIALSTGWTMREWKVTMAKGRVEQDPLSYVVVLGGDLHEEARVGVAAGGGWDPGRVNCLIVDVDGNGTNEIVFGAGCNGAHVFETVPTEDE